MGRIVRMFGVVGALVGAVVMSLAAPASAATVTPVASGLFGPLQFAYGDDGTLYVAQDFGGALTSIDKHGHRTDLVSDPNSEFAGVDAAGKGTVSYTTSKFDPNTGELVFAGAKRVRPNGKTSTLGDLLAYENTNNPDSLTHYGFSDLSTDCAATVPPEITGGGTGYDGIIDSHPYAIAIRDDGARFVADAAGNDILRIDPSGHVSTVAVLPPTPVTVNAEGAQAFGLDECTIGHVYNFESVPTDVEVGPNGLLYVSSLPGGPEIPGLGAVYTVDPRTGAVARIATGFFGATNVAVAPDGTVYVAELSAGQVSKVVNGGPETVATVTDPAAVEWHNGALYASIDVFNFDDGGSIVKITP